MQDTGTFHQVAGLRRPGRLSQGSGQRLFEQSALTLRADVFNAFNTVIITGRNTTVTFDNPTSMRVMNSRFNDNGSLNQNRLKPRDAGFGAANTAADMRNIQLQVRFSF